MALDDFKTENSEDTSKYGTHRVDPEAKFKDKEWLESQIKHRGRTDSSIARQFDVDPETVRYWRKKFDIEPAQTRSEEISSEIPLTQFETDILIGDLLGDGSVVPQNNKARFQSANNKKQYLMFIKNRLPEELYTENCFQRSNGTYSLNTRHTKNLKSMRDKWYPDGKKKLPDDFRLNSTHMLLWYMGDGNLKNPESAPRVTCSWMTEESLIRVKQQLEEFIGNNVSIYTTEGTNRLLVKQESRDQFFRFIGSCPVEEYSYKWIPDYI